MNELGKHREYQKAYWERNKTRLNEKARNKRKAHPEKKYFEMLKNRYGVSREWFEAQMLSQGGKCVCEFEFGLFSGDRNKSPHVDHNHETNEIRGLLCLRCNTVIGLLRLDSQSSEDSFLLFSKLMKYLRVSHDGTA